MVLVPQPGVFHKHYGGSLHPAIRILNRSCSRKPKPSESKGHSGLVRRRTVFWGSVPHLRRLDRPPVPQPRRAAVCDVSQHKHYPGSSPIRILNRSCSRKLKPSECKGHSGFVRRAPCSGARYHALASCFQSLKTQPKLVAWTGGVKNPSFRRLGWSLRVSPLALGALNRPRGANSADFPPVTITGSLQCVKSFLMYRPHPPPRLAGLRAGFRCL